MQTRRSLLATALGVGAGSLAAVRETQAAGTGPWELSRLRRTPGHEMKTTATLTEAGVPIRLSELFYESEPWMERPATRVFGYYARPVDAGDGRPLPAMVLVHGGGGKAFPEWARLWASRGYAALAMDLAGKGADGKPLPDGGPDQTDEWKFRRLKDGVKNAWPYHAVSAVIRCVSLLRSMPEVDADRVGITGISWGGYLTNLVMSLDDRLKAAAPVYDCGFLHENSAWLPVFASLPAAEKQLWVDNFDPSRYLERCRTPMLWVNGTHDFAYPLDSYRKSYQATRGRKTLCITHKMPHGHPQGWAPSEIGRFVDSHFRPGPENPPLARFGRLREEQGAVSVSVESELELRSGQLLWTADLSSPWQQREWRMAAATLSPRGRDGVQMSAALPTSAPAAYFLTATDSRGGTVSTEHRDFVPGEHSPR